MYYVSNNNNRHLGILMEGKKMNIRDIIIIIIHIIEYIVDIVIISMVVFAVVYKIREVGRIL